MSNKATQRTVMKRRFPKVQEAFIGHRSRLFEEFENWSFLEKRFIAEI
jgi:hypothetical protein